MSTPLPQTEQEAVAWARAEIQQIKDERATAKKIFDATPAISFPLKAGTYWIGDPGYIYPDKEWDAFCDTINYDLDDRKGFVHRYQGAEFPVIGTAFGDGEYLLTEGENKIGSMGVDAGLLSVIPVDLAENWPEYAEKSDLGLIVEVDEDCILKAHGGNFDFGGYSVVTDGSDMPELDDEDEEDEEEDEEKDTDDNDEEND